LAKIVAVDDSKFQMKQIQKAILSVGHEIFTGVNGEEGLVLVEEHKPDLIISDLLMPVLDGFGFVEKIRETNKEIPIIVLTADIQETTATRLGELGITALVNKPLSKDPFLKLIDDALKG